MINYNLLYKTYRLEVNICYWCFPFVYVGASLHFSMLDWQVVLILHCIRIEVCRVLSQMI